MTDQAANLIPDLLRDSALLSSADQPGRCHVCDTPIPGGAICESCVWPPKGRQPWRAICPPDYLDTNPEDPRIAATVAQVMPLSLERRGIGVIGDTGTGKTRSLLWRLREEFRAGRQVRVVNHVWFGETATKAFSAGEAADKAGALDRLRAWRTCGILLLDDVGKAAPTERSGEQLYLLAEARQHLVTCWTSRYGSEELARRLGERGTDTVRRLGENCAIVITDQP